MDGVDSFEIEVVYALRERQRVVRFRLPAGSSVEQAVQQSGLLAEFPELDRGQVKLGIFGRRVDPDRKVCAGDRVEIYRTLTADPKEVRRAHAARAVPAGRLVNRVRRGV